MPGEKKPMRYGHSEGHTEVCFDDSGKFIVTCGNDGDVRIWDGLDDDDPRFITVGEKAYSLALRKNKLVTASSNTVQIHTFPDGEPDGILTRFTTNATHVTCNSTGTRVAAGSSDFLVKVVEVTDSSQQKTLRGHQAPVLSVTLDPKDQYLASSSCDGSVIVWNIDDQSPVTRWTVLQKTNDISTTKSLCRLAFQPTTGKFLAVPVDSQVHLYERGSWDHVTTLSDDLITQPVNVLCWSPCGKQLAGASVGGVITIWDINTKLCTERQKHEKGFTVCGLAWSPDGSELAYTDTEGCLGLIQGLRISSTTDSSSTMVSSRDKSAVKEYDDLFDEDDDSLGKPCTGATGEEDDEDFTIPLTGRVKNRGAFLDDDNSLDTGSLRLGPDEDRDDEVDSSIAPPAAVRPVYDGPMPTPPQRAFTPGSTPGHLTHRFMVWNSVGIVRGYNDDQDNAVDVEFHDSAVHHAMHLSNTLGHTWADVSTEAVLLGCPGTHELSSKLQCLHFSSWDTQKEWMVDLPTGEDIRALCLGQGWAAVGTSSLLLRLFSIGGVQKEMFSLTGPVVCLSGYGDQLMIVYHRGTGFGGDQVLGVHLLQLGLGKRTILHQPLPLSPRAQLSWAGFTAEGTPVYVDSEGVVRMLNRSLGNTWTPVCDTKETCRSRSDHYWVVGVHERPQQIRCIPCKGSRFPPTLPRPAVAILPYKLPMCQTTTEKGAMEEQFWRSVLVQNHFSFLESSGFEIDLEAQSQSLKEQQELLMKMFALSCKLEREFRCVELAEMMTQSVLTLAVKYASRSRHMGLAQRLSELALEKVQQENYHQEEEDQSRWGHGEAGEYRRTQEEERQTQEEEEEENPQTLRRVNLLIRDSPDAAPKPAAVSKGARSNPFKVPGASGKSPALPRAPNILDNMAANRKSIPLTSSSNKTKNSPVLKPLAPKPKNKTQTLLQVSSKANRKLAPDPVQTELTVSTEVPEVPSSESTENRRPQTGFQLWLEMNREMIVDENLDLDETELIKEAMGRYRNLPADHRQSWTERAKGQSREEQRKRKTPEEDPDQDQDQDQDRTKKKKMDSASVNKLSAFAFNK